MHQAIDLKKDKLTYTLYKVNEEVCNLTLLGLHIFTQGLTFWINLNYSLFG